MIYMINFNNVPDNHQRRITLYTSGDTKDIKAFIEEVLKPDQYRGIYYGVYSSNLDCIPEGCWEDAKALFRTIEMSVANIQGLIAIKDEAKLKKAIQFAMDYKIQDTRSLIGFNEVEVDQIDAFIETILAKDILAYPKFWSMVYQLPMDQQDKCVTFFKEHEFSDHAYRCGYLLLAKYQQSSASSAMTSQSEALSEISDRLNGLVFTDEVLKLLAEKPHDAVMKYLDFIHTHHAVLSAGSNPSYESSDYTEYLKTYLRLSTDIIDDVYDFFHQADAPRAYFLRLCDFIKENGEAFSANWDAIKYFITTFEAYHTHPDHPLTLTSDHLEYIIKYSKEDVDGFKAFIDDKIRTGDANVRETLFQRKASYYDSKFESLLPLSLDQLEDCFDYILGQGRNMDLYYTSRLAKLNVSDYNHFKSFLDNPPCELKYLKYFLQINPDNWIAVTEMLESLDHLNPLTIWFFNALTNLSDEKLNLLCAFAKQFNVTDPVIIEGLADVPSVRQWQRILELATPLFVNRYKSPDAKAKIITTLYKLTVQEHRFDRAMPMAPGIAGQINFSRRALAWIRQVQNEDISTDVFEKNVLAILKNDFLNAPEVHNFDDEDPAPEENVHAPGRDQHTKNALGIFKAQYDYSTGNEDDDFNGFLSYLAQYPDSFTKLSAEYVLGLKESNTNNAFGPLVQDDTITAYDLGLTAKAFLARIWHFINQGTFIDLLGHEMTGEALIQDRDNAKNSLVQSLAQAYDESGNIVCNAGKLQRIVTGVLQGRFKGISVDNPKFTKEQMSASVANALTDFISSQKEDVSAEWLRENASIWLDANPHGFEGRYFDAFKTQFIKELDDYIKVTYDEVTSSESQNAHQDVTFFRPSGDGGNDESKTNGFSA